MHVSRTRDDPDHILMFRDTIWMWDRCLWLELRLIGLYVTLLHIKWILKKCMNIGSGKIVCHNIWLPKMFDAHNLRWNSWGGPSPSRKGELAPDRKHTHSNDPQSGPCLLDILCTKQEKSNVGGYVPRGHVAESLQKSRLHAFQRHRSLVYVGVQTGRLDGPKFRIHPRILLILESSWRLIQRKILLPVSICLSTFDFYLSKNICPFWKTKWPKAIKLLFCLLSFELK